MSVLSKLVHRFSLLWRSRPGAAPYYINLSDAAVSSTNNLPGDTAEERLEAYERYMRLASFNNRIARRRFVYNHGKINASWAWVNPQDHASQTDSYVTAVLDRNIKDLEAERAAFVLDVYSVNLPEPDAGNPAPSTIISSIVRRVKKFFAR